MEHILKQKSLVPIPTQREFKKMKKTKRTKRLIEPIDSPCRFSEVSKKTNVVINVIFLILASAAVIPFVFVLMISLTSEQSIRTFGYQFIPNQLSLDSYRFLLREIASIGRAFGVSIFVTVVGTSIGVTLTTLMGYVLSRKEFKLKGFYTYFIFIPMIFNGGMLASYVVNTQVLGLGNSIWALILPLSVSSFNVVICRTYFQTAIPDSIVESAKIDGASPFRTFIQIVMPLAKPMIATIALFLSFGYWSDWFQSSLYITNSNLFSLQALLDNIQRSLEFITNNPSVGASLAQYRVNMPQEGVRMAMAVLIIAPIACSYPFFQKYFISGLTVGAVKG